MLSRMLIAFMKENDIFPLRDSRFENIPVKIPYEYTKLLRDEYGAESMTRTEFAGYGLELSLIVIVVHLLMDSIQLSIRPRDQDLGASKNAAVSSLMCVCCPYFSTLLIFAVGPEKTGGSIRS